MPNEVNVPEGAVEASFLGKWVRLLSNGKPFRVLYLGHKQRDGRCRLYGPCECVWPEEVERLDPDKEEKAREEWERHVR